MKKLLFVCLVSLFGFYSYAINDTIKKKYTYIEINFDKSTKNPITFFEKNDTIAYANGMNTFSKSYLSIKDTAKRPLIFNLFNDKNEKVIINDLSKYYEKIYKEELQKAKLEEEKAMMEYKATVKERENVVNSIIGKDNIIKKRNEKDNAKIELLKDDFDIKKEKFSNNNLTWYVPDSFFLNFSCIYIYFSSENDMVGNLRLFTRYKGSNWIFYNKISFLIDDVNYEYIPIDKNTQVISGNGISEWSDNSITFKDKKLISALYNAKKVEIKYSGDNRYDTRVMKSKEIEFFKKSIDFYNALGGDYNINK
jgi:hypothetical protein